jgi:hypothetical protein
VAVGDKSRVYNVPGGSFLGFFWAGTAFRGGGGSHAKAKIIMCSTDIFLQKWWWLKIWVGWIRAGHKLVYVYMPVLSFC